jgi:hypothetical protein
MDIIETKEQPDINSLFWEDLANQFISAKEFDERYVEDLHRFMTDFLYIRSAWFDEKGHDQIVKFIPSPFQLRYAAMKAEAVAKGRKPWYLVLKARQRGITTYEQGVSFHMVCTRRHVQCLTFADTEPKSRKIFIIVNRFYRNMPEEFRPIKGISETQISFPDLDNFFNFYTAGGRAVARGETLSRFHGSEVARWDLNPDQFADLMSGLTGACKHGEIVLETTAQGPQGWFYEEWIRAMEGDSEYTPIFLPWYADPWCVKPLKPDQVIERTPEEVERSLRFGPWSDEQINFRRDEQAIHRSLFPQEFPETWEEAFLAKGNCFFNIELVKSLYARCKPALEEHDNGALQVWIQPQEGMNYYIGADTAEGVQGGDYDAAYVLDQDGRQCAALHGKWPEEVYARKLGALGRYYNAAVLAVEANNHGHSVLNTLRNVDHYPRLYEHVGYDADPGAKGKLGWQTTAKTRPILLDMLRDEAVEGKAMEINDSNFLRECSSFNLSLDGRKYEASSGAHDDRVMACGIAWAVRRSAPRRGDLWII